MSPKEVGSAGVMRAAQKLGEMTQSHQSFQRVALLFKKRIGTGLPTECSLVFFLGHNRKDAVGDTVHHVRKKGRRLDLVPPNAFVVIAPLS
jgi:hypothetical protein